MQAFIKFSSNVTDFLFRNWSVSTPAGFAGLCFGLLIVSVLLHAIKEFQGVFHERCVQNLIVNCKPYPEFHSEIHPQTLHLSICAHVVHSALYVIQVILEYAIMLSIMKFNGWLFIVIVLGSGLGYFVLSAFMPPHVDYKAVDATNTLPPSDESSPNTSLA